MRQPPHPTKCTAFRPENGLALGQTDLIPTRLPGCGLKWRNAVCDNSYALGVAGRQIEKLTALAIIKANPLHQRGHR